MSYDHEDPSPLSERDARVALLLLTSGAVPMVRRAIRAAGSGLAALARHPDPPDPGALRRRVRLELDRVAAAGALAVIPDDPAFPPSLRQIPDPPVLLFMRGETRLAADELSRVAVVGSRDADLYGLSVAERFTAVLAAAGVVVVSGGARGIDAHAHFVTLAAGGSTIAVLGAGLARPSPTSSRPLLDRMVREGGLLVTEYPWACPPRRYHFPDRNRLIAALGHATLVVQASARSGTLHTASRARELGRPVLAVPGDVCYRSSAGTNGLLTKGEAFAATSPADVLCALGRLSAAESGWPPLGRRPRELPPGWREDAPRTVSLSRTDVELDDPLERAIVAELESGSSDIDTLAERLSCPVEQALAALSGLELLGRVRRTEGNRYVLRVA